MKKAAAILELPILEVLEGKTIGKAQDIIVNTDLQNIYLVLDGNRAGNRSLLNLRDVLGIGEDYIILKSITSIKKISENKELVTELENSFALINMPVISTSGDALGKIVDFEVSDAKDAILNIQLDSGETYEKEEIYSICEKYVFVQRVAPIDVLPSRTDREEKEEKIAKEDEYLIGLTLQKDIKSKDGEFELKSGTQLTIAMINEAREHEAIVELATNAE